MNKAEIENFRSELKAFYEDICKSGNDGLKEKGKYIIRQTNLLLDYLEKNCYVERQIVVLEKPSMNNTSGLFSYIILKIINGKVERTVKKYERAVE